MTDARTSPRPEAAAGYRVKATLAEGATLLSADETAWSAAGTIAWGPPRYRTAFRALWTAHALYARFDATDPDPWHTMSAHDDCLWEEEVVELFLDPAGQGRDYFELEISPANVTCDVRVRTPYPNLVSELAWDHEGLATAVCALRGPDRHCRVDGGSRAPMGRVSLPARAGARRAPSGVGRQLALQRLSDQAAGWSAAAEGRGPARSLVAHRNPELPRPLRFSPAPLRLRPVFFPPR